MGTVTPEQVLSKVKAWGQGEENVRGLILVGFRAGDVPPDNLADIDLQVFVKTAETYTQSEAWLSKSGEVWVCVHNEYYHGEVLVPTRLVIFNAGTKIDFAFYATVVRETLVHRVLLDKEVHSRT